MLRIASSSMVLVAVLAHGVPAAADPDVYPPPPVYAARRPPPTDPDDAPMVRPDPTAESHDGTYVRLYIGPGYLHSSVSEQGSTLILKGTGVGFGVAVGGAVAPNLIIYGALSFLTVSDPTVTIDGSSSSTSGTSFDHIGLGPGVTYYFMPLNVYL